MYIKKRLIEAVKKTVLVSATIHLVVLGAYTVKAGNLKALNFFNVLDLDLFEPAIIQGPTSDIIAIGTLATMLIYFFFFA